MKSNFGFTLLELLVSISIIGTLSTVIFASVGSARQNAKVSVVNQSLGQMMRQSTMEQLQEGEFNPAALTPGWVAQESDCESIENFQSNVKYKSICQALVKTNIDNSYGPFFMTVDTDGEMVVAAALGGDTYTCQRGRSRVSEFTMTSDTDWPSACNPIGTAYAGSGGGGGSNQSPTVSYNGPSEGTNGSAISLSASASDSDGTISNVSFSIDGTTVATDTTLPYSATWTPTTEGTYNLVVTATDNGGAFSSDSESLVVTASSPGGGSTITSGSNSIDFTHASTGQVGVETIINTQITTNDQVQSVYFYAEEVTGTPSRILEWDREGEFTWSWTPNVAGTYVIWGFAQVGDPTSSVFEYNRAEQSQIIRIADSSGNVPTIDFAKDDTLSNSVASTGSTRRHTLSVLNNDIDDYWYGQRPEICAASGDGFDRIWADKYLFVYVDDQPKTYNLTYTWCVKDSSNNIMESEQANVVLTTS